MTWPLRPLTEADEEGTELIVSGDCAMDVEDKKEVRKDVERDGGQDFEPTKNWNATTPEPLRRVTSLIILRHALTPTMHAKESKFG